MINTLRLPHLLHGREIYLILVGLGVRGQTCRHSLPFRFRLFFSLFSLRSGQFDILLNACRTGAT